MTQSTVLIEPVRLSQFAADRNEAGNCLHVWTSPRAWFMLLPLLYFTVQGHINTGTVAQKLRLAVQADTSVERWGFIFLVIGSFAITVKRFSFLWPKILAVKGLVGLSLLALISVLWSGVPRRTAFNGVGELAVTLLAIYLVSEFSPSEQMQLIILPGFIAMLCCFWVVAFYPSIGMDAEEGGAWRGIFEEKNVLGLVVFFLAMPFVHLQLRSNFDRLFRVFYLGMASYLIYMSKAKTAWVICILYLAFILIMRVLKRFRERDSAVLAVFIGTVGTALAAEIYRNSASVLQVLGKDPTLNERTVIWAAVWESITKRFFLGYGYCGFWSGLSGPSLNVVLVSGWMVGQAQNGYLDAWLGVGFIGILTLFLVLSQAVRDLFVCFQLSREGFVQWYGAILFCSVAYNFSESFLIDPRHICWFLFMIACVGLRQKASGLRALKAQSRIAYRPLAYTVAPRIN